MVKVYCNKVTSDWMEWAKWFANRLDTVVYLITPTGTMEVHHEKVSEVQDTETQ